MAYRLKTSDGGVTDKFIFSMVVVPNGRKILEDKAGLVIGTTVLWAAFHKQLHTDPKCPLLQPWLRTDKIKVYEEACGTTSDVVHNSVKKVIVVLHGNGDELYLIEIGVNLAGEQIQVEGRRDTTDMTFLQSHSYKLKDR